MKKEYYAIPKSGKPRYYRRFSPLHEIHCVYGYTIKSIYSYDKLYAVYNRLIYIQL